MENYLLISYRKTANTYHIYCSNNYSKMYSGACRNHTISDRIIYLMRVI